jgi:hypothetical protein
MRTSNLQIDRADDSSPDSNVAWTAFLAVAVASITLAALVEGAAAVAILFVGFSLACRAHNRLSRPLPIDRDRAPRRRRPNPAESGQFLSS